MKFKTNIEICEMPSEDKVAARTHIKMTALKISDNNEDNNGNGINWNEKYVKDNIKSIIGAPYKVCFVDEDKTIPSGHGDIEYDSNGNLSFPNSDTVGTIMDAYIDKIDVDNSNIKVLTTEGYLFNQSYPNFIKWLKDETNQGTVYGSVEINGKGDSKKIIYANGTGTNLDGSPQIGRMPQNFDFTALAILSSLVEPADTASQVIEINSKQEGDDKLSEKTKIEIDNSKESADMSGSWNVDKGIYFNNCKDASNARSVFNEAYLESTIPEKIEDIIEADCKYPHHVFTNGKLVVSKAGVIAAGQRLAANDPNNEKAKKHLKKHYNELGLELPEFLGGKAETNSKLKIQMSKKVEVNELCIDDIVCIVSKAFNVAMSMNDTDDVNCCDCYKYYPYKVYPQSGRIIFGDCSTPIQYFLVTYSIENDGVTIGDVIPVEQDWKPIDDEQESEINISKIKEKLNKEVNSMDDKIISEMNQKIENKTNEINSLTNKNTELNEAVTTANKALEEANAKVKKLTDELNTCKTELDSLKTEKQKTEDEKKKAEVNSYFENEIPKDGFDDTEVNSLKSFVESNDIEGLKKAEADICTKKFKEMRTKKPDVETNSKNMIKIHEKDKKVIGNEIPTFFN